MSDVVLPIHGVSEKRPDFASVADIFDHAVATAPEVVAVRHKETSLTYAELGRAVAALARRIGSVVAPGEVAAVVVPNSAEFVVAYFAAVMARAAPALLNSAYPQAQIEPLLREVTPRAILCTPATFDRVTGLCEADIIRLGEDVALPELAAQADAPAADGAAPDDVGAILFSGGTTGIPKAVEHTQAHLVIATRCMEYIWPAGTSGEVWLSIAPFTHIYGFLEGLLVPIFSRATVVIPDRFKPEHIVDLVVRHRVTVFGGGPPAIYAGVLAAPNLAEADLSALRVCPAGGAPMPVELHQRWRQVTGLEVHEAYGMTELAPISGTSELTGVRPGSVGKALPCNHVRIVDVESGTRVLPPGENGEVCARGPHMMAGYRDRPEETAQTIRDGYVHTGDIGYLDEDGFLFITDRKKDMVIVKGFNVFPREVEEVIHRYPKVAEAGVIGAPDPRTGGERLVAFIVPGPEDELTADEITAHCVDHLAAYKCPTDVRIVSSLPMTGVHKLDRSALRRAAAGEG